MTSPCPDAETLRRFSIGDLTGAQFEQVALHVQECEACGAALADWDQHGDELLDHLQTLSLTPEEQQSQDSSTHVAVIVAALEQRMACELPFDAGSHYSWKLQQGPCHLGKFELLEEVGVGSFGHVFRAKDTELDRIVAIKIQRAGRSATEDETRRFLREARSASALNHPGIVSLHETGQTEDGVSFLVTEFVESETLAAVIERNRMPVPETVELILRLAEALHYAHEHGIIHRDVKPSNVLVDGDGMPHITDFGLAKRESLEATLTAEGQILGTPAYMSPEQARGDVHGADQRTDIYSLGVILYEMLTGERPFQGNRRLLLLQVLEDEPRAPRKLVRTLPRDLEIICLKAISKSPARRYQSAQEFADDLKRYLSGDEIQARPMGNTERLWRWCRKYPLAAALFIGVTVGSVAGFLYLRHLNTWFVREMALDTARQYSDALEVFNETYSDTRGEFFQHGEDPGTVPPALPATLQIEVAERISLREDGMQVRIFSPFSFREELRPRDNFERVTQRKFESIIEQQAEDQKTALEYFEFVSIEGRSYLKFARGQRMTTSCLDCHNNHKDTPKSDWKKGDLAGVLTLTRPLDRDIARTQTGFRGASLLMLTIAFILTTGGVIFAWRVRPHVIRKA